MSIKTLPIIAVAAAFALAALLAFSGQIFQPSTALAQSPPNTPSSVSVTRADGALTASWDAVSGATSYHITYTSNNGTSWSLGALNHPNSSITISSIDNSKTYIVGVRARNEHGDSLWRNSPPSGPFTPSTPGTPSSVSVTRSDRALTASWDAVSGATSYHITYTSNNGTSWSLAALNHPDSSITITGVTNSLTYIVGVRARNSAGDSIWRNSTPAGPFQPPTPTPTATATPTPTPTSTPTPTPTATATPTPTPTYSPTPVPTPDPLVPVLNVSDSGEATWSYNLPQGANFSYSEVRWKVYNPTESINDWSGRSSTVFYSADAGEYQIPNLDSEKRYKAKVFVGVNQNGGVSYLKSNVVVLPKPIGSVTTATALSLYELYEHLDGVNWSNNDNWMSGWDSVADWYGVSIVPMHSEQADHVTELLLSDNNLKGTIPEPGILDSFTHLRVLELDGNSLTGTLPMGLTNLENVERLIFGDNDGLCAPLDAKMQNWLDSIATVEGPDCDE